MSEKYSSEFKAKVALEAVSQSRSVIQKIAEKHDISEEEVISWAAQLNEDAASLFGAETTHVDDGGEVEDVDITTNDEEFAAAVSHGVMSDNLNYGKLIFWSTLGASLVIIFVIGLVYFSQYSLFEAQKEASSRVTYSDFSALVAEQKQELNSFGVVDLEEGIYRIPIDSAINRIAIED
ncbi:MAG TPA: transposase [Gracilimonas sp.]|uniref:transposase n=1 Tax=Gracilimonas sp. TaxID=1974203 RepID=UPI002D8B99EB|nr:transposase [Gracilimonas sp.]